MSAQTQAEHEATCKTCNRPKGLPILLTRYAVAPEDPGDWYAENKPRVPGANAPKLSGNFHCDAVKAPSTTHYTQRLLRPGFLYVFDEARNIWSGYVVSEQAYLTPFDPPTRASAGDEEAVIKSDSALEVVPCKPVKPGRALAGAITVPFPDKATNLWITLSDVQWTHEVWKKFNANEGGCRDKAMRKIDIGAWAKGGALPDHAAPIEKLADCVAEYHKETTAAAFAFCNESFAVRSDYWSFEDLARQVGGKVLEMYEAGAFAAPILATEANRLPAVRTLRMVLAHARQSPADAEARLETYRRSSAQFVIRDFGDAHEKGLIVALDDPIGIVQDLAELMDFRHGHFITQKKYVQAIPASGGILELKNKIYKLAADKEEKEKTLATERRETYLRKHRRDTNNALVAKTGERQIADNTKRMLTSDDTYYEKFLTPAEKAECDRQSQVLDEDLMTKGDQIWRQKYLEKDGAPRYREEERAKIQAEFDKQSREISEQAIAPLAVAHATWMESENITHRFVNDFDPGHLGAGAAFAETVSACVGGSADKGACEAFYEKAVKADPKDPKNYIARAFFLNNTDMIADFKETVKALAKQEEAAREEAARQEAEEAARQDTSAITPEEREKEKRAREEAEIAKVAKKEEKTGIPGAQAALLKQVVEKHIYGAFVKSFKTAVSEAFTAGAGKYTWDNVKKEWNTLKSGNLAEIARKLDEQGKPEKKTALGRLIVQLSGVLAKDGVNVLEKGASEALLAYRVRMSGLSGNPFYLCKVTDTRRNFLIHTIYTAGVKTHLAQNGKPPSAPDVRRILQNAAQTVRQMVLQLRGSNPHFDFDALETRRLPVETTWREYYGTSGRLQHLSQKNRTTVQRGILDGYFRVNGLDNLRAMSESRWVDVDYSQIQFGDKVMKEDGVRSRNYVRPAFKFTGRYVLPTAFQGTALVVSITALTVSSKNIVTAQPSPERRVTAIARFTSAIASTCAALAGAAEAVYKSKLVRVKLKIANAKKMAERFGTYVKRLGAIGGALSAVADAFEAKEQYDRGNIGLMAAYIASGAVGLTSAATMVWGATIAGFFKIAVLWLGIILLVLAIVLAVVIALVSDNALQEWLEDCFFGRKSYHRVEDEIEAYQAALV